MQKLARKCALDLLQAGAKKKSWTPYQRAQWTKAFNALQRLSGKKLVLNEGKLVRDRA